VVVPVYLGETTLAALVTELEGYTQPFTTADGNLASVEEILLVNDNGPDDSSRVIRELEARVPQVRGIWLTRNFGQHAATIAGMASSGNGWIVTMDEDGQHNPADIPGMLDKALQEGAHVVYAAPTNRPPHGFVRSSSSRLAKRLIASLFADKHARPSDYQSFRLVLGEVGRSVAAYSGSGVYLDIALGWVTTRVTTLPVELRAENRAVSGYSYPSLLAHFWRMVLSSGTRGLRIVSVLGAIFALVGVFFAIYFLIQRLAGGDFPQGWTTVVIVALLSSGAILISLGIIAEYLGVAVNMAMGKPLYTIMNDPDKGPLGRRKK
jgi:undecaprenyl-phosphate 4-deoxy-4-formamido-L-arabinose transferase